MKDIHTATPFSADSARNGMVCSVDDLASRAGVSLLRKGGTAVDAAIGASAVLAVTNQHMCGVGGALWALVHVPGRDRPFALNASARARSAADLERLRTDGLPTMPFHRDPRSIPIPGCVDGWLALHERFGSLPLGQILDDAITLATEGFPISLECAAATALLENVDHVDDYLSSGKAEAGQIIRRPGLGEALKLSLIHI